MNTEVKEDANQTLEFERNILQRLLKGWPLHPDESMDFVLDEEKDLLPAFKEKASPISREMLNYPVKSKEDFEKALKLYPPEYNMKAELLNIERRNELKAQDLKLYLRGRFNSCLRVLDVVMIRKNPLKVRILLTIKNPEELYKMADQVGATRLANNSGEIATGKWPATRDKIMPTLSENKGRGFLSVPNHNPHQIFIGKINSRPYKLLWALFNPKIGMTRTLDGLFEAIRIKKDENNHGLTNFATKETAKITIIKDVTSKIYTKLKRGWLQGALKVESSNKSYKATWQR